MDETDESASGNFGNEGEGRSTQESSQFHAAWHVEAEWIGISGTSALGEGVQIS